ncbi:DNA/RNA non-specific endonuclease [Porphyromonas pogonae]|uniref:DNA/RNA non-specific endonuclease n=1 Tax=Porphyromonas pogonae TaxID=867595 RepID=UPI002E7A2858|nr:DNA/RNA non-specific endonuclease [Porphyromonas pogonae]
MKNNYLLSFIISSIVLIFATSCQRDADEGIDNRSSSRDMAFTASLENYEMCDASTVWDTRGKIGLFFKTSDMEQWVPGKNIAASNMEFEKQGPSDQVRFVSGTSDKTPTLRNGSKVDILAYYPYADTLKDNSIEVDITNQSRYAQAGLLYSDNLNGVTWGSPENNMIFRNAMAKIRFIITSMDGSSLKGLTVTLEDFPSKGTFNVLTRKWKLSQEKENIPALVTVSNTMAIAEAYIMPCKREKGMRAVLRLPQGREYSWKVRRSNKPFVMGNLYSYDIQFKNSTGTVINEPEVSGYKELPLITSIPNTLKVQHNVPGQQGVRNYTILYDTKLRFAYWVAYPLHKMYMGNARRTDSWAYDPMIDKALQPNLFRSYTMGYDRGHQLPSADRTSSRDINQTTFYFSNMSPQAASLNQGMWQKLERKVRAWQKKLEANGAGKDTLYVVTGAGINKQLPLDYVADGAGARMPVPHYHYKALAMMDNQGVYHAIAFKMPNNLDIPRSGNINNYRITVKELESETGFTFFPFLSEGVKGHIDDAYWR